MSSQDNRSFPRRMTVEEPVKPDDKSRTSASTGSKLARLFGRSPSRGPSPSKIPSAPSEPAEQGKANRPPDTAFFTTTPEGKTGKLRPESAYGGGRVGERAGSIHSVRSVQSRPGSAQSGRSVALSPGLPPSSPGLSPGPQRSHSRSGSLWERPTSSRVGDAGFDDEEGGAGPRLSPRGSPRIY